MEISKLNIRSLLIQYVVGSVPSGRELNKLIQDFGNTNKELAQKDTLKNASSKAGAPAVAAWFVSNCNSRSGREDLVDQLQKVLQVREE